MSLLRRVLSEIHLTDRCKKFNSMREELIFKLLKLEIRNPLLWIHELVGNLQFNDDIYNFTKEKRLILLNMIKQFINERRIIFKKLKKIATF